MAAFDVAGDVGWGAIVLDVAVDVPKNYFARPVVNFRGLGDLQVV